MFGEPYVPKGIRFIDLVTNREMMLVDDGEHWGGWIVYKHPDGQWVSLRKATDEDRAAVAAAPSVIGDVAVVNWAEVCQHFSFDVDAQIGDPLPGGARALRLTVRCAHCGIVFRFNGLPVGHFDPAGANVSADGGEARLSISPNLRKKESEQVSPCQVDENGNVSVMGWS